MTHTQRRSRRGFTLIELLVAATIIILLTTIGIVSFTATNKRARDGKRKADLEQVRSALELYRSDTTLSGGVYPAPVSGDAIASFTNLMSTLSTNNYIANPTPQDPVNVSPNVYSYWYGSSGTTATYCLCAYLDDATKANSSSGTCTFSGTPRWYCITNP